MAALVDTNVLVYRFDSRFPDKQRLATERLRAGIADGSVVVPHQAIVEFVRCAPALGGRHAALDLMDARREAEELLSQFEVLFPDEELVRIALRGAAAYQLSWFDAHMWRTPSDTESKSCCPRTSSMAASTAPFRRSTPSSHSGAHAGWGPRRRIPSCSGILNV